jgi:hypothetical protein
VNSCHVKIPKKLSPKKHVYSEELIGNQGSALAYFAMESEPLLKRAGSLLLYFQTLYRKERTIYLSSIHGLWRPHDEWKWAEIVCNYRINAAS